jgi:type II protein arginine methyltransferase
LAKPALTKAALDALVAQAEGNPLAQAHLARILANERYRRVAYALAFKASAAAPNDPVIQRVAAEVYELCVPAWHFPIVHDDARNIAYESAIKRAIRPGMRVLEIGTGTGLFAMMAARAGAAKVISCDSNIPVADAATAIIAKNGFADRVSIIAKESTDLDAVADLGGKADLLICEIIANDLLDDSRQQMMRHAVEHLLKRDAQIIPAQATARVALAEDVDQHYRRMDLIAGFDLSPFNRLAAPRYLFDGAFRKPILRSAPADLMTHDFRPSRSRPPTQGQTSLVAQGGTVNGIAEWVALNLDDYVRYENHPCTHAGRCWSPVFYDWEQARDVPAGTSITVYCRQDGSGLHIWADGIGVYH